jgi:DNA (cytosine-5)-methyltransferase 1
LQAEGTGGRGYRNDADGAASNHLVINALDRRGGGDDENDAQSNRLIVGLSENQRGELLETDYAHQLSVGGGKPGQGYPAVRDHASVRRLTPTECERLMSWPDGWTLPGSDTKRYAACGDGVVSNVAEWIGIGIRKADRSAKG